MPIWLCSAGLMLLLASMPDSPLAAAAIVPSVGGALRVCLGPVELVSWPHLLVLYGLFSETRGGGGTVKSSGPRPMLMRVQGKGKMRKGCQGRRRYVV